MALVDFGAGMKKNGLIFFLPQYLFDYSKITY